MVLTFVKDGVVSGFGVPDFFVKNEDLIKLLKDSTLRTALLDKVGGTMRIGILGDCVNGIYEEKAIKDLFIADELKGGQCFYDRV